MQELNIEQIVRPTKILEFGVVKIHLQGSDSIQYDYIHSVMQRTFLDYEQVENATREYYKRLICSTVKKVEGVQFNGEDFELKFSQDGRVITDSSYELLNLLMDKILQDHKTNLNPEIKNFFYESREKALASIEFKIDDKKKD